MEVIELSDASSRWAELVARAESGEVTVIARGGQPVAKLVPVYRPEHGVTASRRAAIEALLAFKPIVVQGTSVAGVVHTGRE
jgi:prevent-host-death family protein